MFPLSSGSPGWVAGVIASLVKAGAKKIALFGDGSPGDQFFASLVEQTFATIPSSAGVHLVANVEGTETGDPTYAVSAAKLVSSGADAVFVTTPWTNLARAVNAIKQAGFKGRIAGILGAFTPAVVKALGSEANGIYMVAFPSDASNAAAVQFKADVAKYAPNFTLSEDPMSSWTSVRLFAAVMEDTHSSSYDSAAVLSAFNKLGAPRQYVGTMDPYGAPPNPPNLAGFPRMFSSFTQSGQIENGVVRVSSSQLLDPFKYLRHLGS